MQRLFLAGILILVGTSAISAQQSNFGFGTFCHKVCRYEVERFNPLTAHTCKTAKALGQDCICAVRCNQNRVHLCPQPGRVECL
jgi:hypothetical protein